MIRRMNAVACPSCQTVAAPGAKFCSECGTALARSCPSCGNAVDAAAKFCSECGTAVNAAVEPTETAPAPTSAAVAERRLVTVLFADLVGFTTLSESRDAEDVRELLSRYFETARNVIDRYGGRVEKSIGDAVMALWGAPVAQEDDAERAVRAAFELVSAVEAMGAEAGASDLRLRAGKSRLAWEFEKYLDGLVAAVWWHKGRCLAYGDAMDCFARSLSAARNLGELLVIARVLAGYARALVRAGRADEAGPLAAEAREAFEGMGAVRAIARLDAAMPAGVTA
jgi:Adenylate and Guanylate cyclase catalytic domain/Double zinc ribbon